MISEEEARIFAKYLSENTFFGPNSWYVNGKENEIFSEAVKDKTIEQPALFVHATYDYVCTTTSSPKLMASTREACKNLTEKRIDCGHWMAQEKPDELNLILKDWLSEI